MYDEAIMALTISAVQKIPIFVRFSRISISFESRTFEKAPL